MHEISLQFPAPLRGTALADKLASVSLPKIFHLLVWLVNFFPCFLMGFMVLHGFFARHVHAH